MRHNNKTCIVCSEKYTFCPSCAEFDHLPRWYNIYHNENCKNIFNIAARYLEGALTKEEARSKFQECDLSYKDKLNKKIVEVINEVSVKKRATKSNVPKQTIVEELVDVVEETTAEQISEDEE